jgi:hypothetical protein
VPFIKRNPPANRRVSCSGGLFESNSVFETVQDTFRYSINENRVQTADFCEFTELFHSFREGIARNVEIFAKTIVSENSERGIRLGLFFLTTAFSTTHTSGVEVPLICTLFCHPPKWASVSRCPYLVAFTAKNVVFSLVFQSFSILGHVCIWLNFLRNGGLKYSLLPSIIPQYQNKCKFFLSFRRRPESSLKI